jgi:putative transcriptional regulator
MYIINNRKAIVFTKKTMENKVRYYRFMNKEMTQQELAERAGVTRQTIIAIEKGAFNPSVRLALKMSRIFNINVEVLFSLSEND